MNSSSSIKVLLILLTAVSCLAEPISFKRDIAPILLSQCQGCHGPKKAKGKCPIDKTHR